MRVKITDLTEEKTFYRRDKDASGNVTREPYQAKAKRKVQTVQGGKRFGHYLIDYALMFCINFGLGVLGVFSTTLDNSGGLEVMLNVAGIFTTVFYYVLLESTMGTTIGKLATNSVVVDEYGDKPDIGRIIGRSFARIIPFEAFSCLGERGWHDTLSKTFVVTKTELKTLKRLQSEQSGEGYVDDREDLLD